MHEYDKGLAFYYVPKSLFDELLDLVKQYDIKEYEKEKESGFTHVYRHWNMKGITAIKEHIAIIKKINK